MATNHHIWSQWPLFSVKICILEICNLIDHRTTCRATISAKYIEISVYLHQCNQKIKKSPKWQKGLKKSPKVFGIAVMPFLWRGIWFSPKLSYHWDIIYDPFPGSYMDRPSFCICYHWTMMFTVHFRSYSKLIITFTVYIMKNKISDVYSPRHFRSSLYVVFGHLYSVKLTILFLLKIFITH